MLVLVSFGLVLLATILLVVGLLADTLTLIYLSIAASFTAAVVLYLAFRRARPKADTDLVAPTPIPPEGAEDESTEVDPTTITPGATTPETVVAAEEPEVIDAEDAPALVDDPATSAAGDDWTTDADWADDGEFDVEFPIADYDDLTVAEIMPLLPQLYTDELGVVAERERTGKNRAAILDRLDELAATGTDADALEAASIDADDAFAPAAAPAAAVAESPRNDALSTPPATPRPAPAPPQVPSLSDDEDDDGFVFPIAAYDELGVDQIVPLLAQLEDDELEDVKAREVAGQGRRSVIAEIDRQLGLVDAVGARADRDGTWAEPAPEPAPAPEPRPAPAPEPAGSSMLAIAGYDGLTVAQIRPLLAGLSHDELRAVLDHEVARDNRRTIVADIERRLGAGGPAPTAAARATKAPARKATKKATAKKATAKKATTKRSAKKSARATKQAAAPKFPIADYDTLTVAQIRPKLAGLSEAQLRQVQAREADGAGRKTILNEIASRLG
ncbi:hypothetical protein NHL50_05945 [Acidimicrobiia bacterium EGI L10123]|uniref:hypothetical protein n=1 Tax=Salinilacustrithrix flava TaxID=2957203 RepID=UPI003D7C3202|nr:hypothetical protein [Acidimicrobiia bacterium EGI L10123]